MRPISSSWPGLSEGMATQRPVGIEAPAVIAAFDLAPVECAVAQRDAAVRADIAEREHHPVRRPAQQQGLAEQHFRHGVAPAQALPRKGEIPHLPQGGGGVRFHHHVLNSGGAGELSRGGLGGKEPIAGGNLVLLRNQIQPAMFDSPRSSSIGLRNAQRAVNLQCTKATRAQGRLLVRSLA